MLLRRIRQALCKHNWKVGTKRIEGANSGWLRYAECKKCKLLEGILYSPDPPAKLEKGENPCVPFK